MTHGAGSIGGGGGGGGGGFSGGFSLTGTTHVHSRRRRDNDTDNAECCCMLCTLIFFLLCLTKMKPRTRIGLTWFYVVGGSILTGCLVAKHFNTTTIPVSPTDMREVNIRSSVFCESIILDSTEQLAFYSFTNSPTIMKQPTKYYRTQLQGNIEQNTYEYWGFYLLLGSIIKTRICGDAGLELYIIKGTDNFNKWVDDNFCVDCFEDNYYLTGCEFSYPLKTDLTASESDQYYFLFANLDDYVEPPKKVFVDFYVNRTLYNTSGATLVSDHSNDFTFPLGLSQTKSIVFEAPDSISFDTKLTVTCNPRIYMYIILFGVLPTVSGLIVTLLIVRKAQRNRIRERSDSQVFVVSNNERLHGFANDSFQIQTAPPSYSSYVDAPPSYEEATAERT